MRVRQNLLGLEYLPGMCEMWARRNTQISNSLVDAQEKTEANTVALMMCEHIQSINYWITTLCLCILFNDISSKLSPMLICVFNIPLVVGDIYSPKNIKKKTFKSVTFSTLVTEII